MSCASGTHEAVKEQAKRGKIAYSKKIYGHHRFKVGSDVGSEVGSVF